MAIANVRRAGVREYPFHRSTIGTDHQVVTAQIQRFNREWIEWQKMAMRFSRCWSFAQKRGDYFMVAKCGRQFPFVKKESEDIRGRKKLPKRLGYSLTPAKSDKPMMNYRYSHILNS